MTNKPVVIYPNSGETYDAENKQWEKSTGVADEDCVICGRMARCRDFSLWWVLQNNSKHHQSHIQDSL
ncbi:hypothetical protein CRYUN_Cryun40dG0043200 [Craigia yunnanensis]